MVWMVNPDLIWIGSWELIDQIVVVLLVANSAWCMAYNAEEVQMFESTVRSGTQYHLTGSWDSEGCWLQLMCCAYLLAVSMYFRYAEGQDPGSWEFRFQKL